MADVMHYGIKGMRWGVRRPVGPDGLVTGSVKSAARNLSNLKNVRNKELKSLTNEELRSRVDRVSKENRLKKLSRSKEDKRAYKSRGSMSDKELNERVERLQLEATLRSESLKSNKETIKLVNDALQQAGNWAVKEAKQHKFSDSKAQDEAIKLMIKQATKKIRDGKAIPNK